MDGSKCALGVEQFQIRIEVQNFSLTTMKTIELKLPEIGLLAMTRAALGVGLGLLLSSKLDERQRRAAGVALVLLGALTTVPFALHFFADQE